MERDIPAWRVSELSTADRAALERHFLTLDADDRRLRFGVPLPDSTVRAYVQRIDFGHDVVFGVLDEELRLLGVAHLARADGQAELGVSVLAGHRNRGLGNALLERASLRARNWGVRALFMHCLGENDAMMHIARKQRMHIVTEAGEADAWLELPAPDAASLLDEAVASNLALFDHTLKRQLAGARALQRALLAAGNSSSG